jgi:hypothetical protein
VASLFALTRAPAARHPDGPAPTLQRNRNGSA